MLKRSKPSAAPVSAERAEIRQVVAVAGVRDHDLRPGRRRPGQRLERGQPGLATAFVCTITGAPVSIAASATASRMRRHVADESVPLDGAFEERGLHAGVVDPLADLAHEDLGDRLGASIAEEVRQLEEGVDARSRR